MSVSAARARPTATVRVLVIDDQPEMGQLVCDALASDRVVVHTACSPLEGLELFSRIRPQLVLLDLMMPEMNGIEVLERIVAVDPVVDVVLITGSYSTSSAVEAIQKGAADYLPKPVDVSTLRERVGRLLQDLEARAAASEIDQLLLETSGFFGMVGRSPAMLELFAKLRRIAPHFRTVLIEGPTGSGKELLARALHQLSPTPAGPFVACNCSAIPESLAESELFGHIRGAYTGAMQDRAGWFEQAHGGTLFLDEVGELPLPLQAKLLRAVEYQEIQRLGATVQKKVNVRIVAATNRNLRPGIEPKTFREDLWFRLGTIRLDVPPLRSRPDDLPLLEQHFVTKYSTQYGKEVMGLTRRAQRLIRSYSWPGNVRELEHALAHGAMMARNEWIDACDLPETLAASSLDSSETLDPGLSLEEVSRRHVRRVLESVGGNKTAAAEILQISRATLYKYIADPDSPADQ